MDHGLPVHVREIRRSTPDAVPLGLRLVVAALVARPALSKVLTYDSSVAFFDRYGLPAPELSVVAAGVVEVAAVVMLVAGVRERVAALALVPVMVVAMLYVGPDWKNVAVLAGALAILVLGGPATSEAE